MNSVFFSAIALPMWASNQFLFSFWYIYILDPKKHKTTTPFYRDHCRQKLSLSNKKWPCKESFPWDKMGNTPRLVHNVCEQQRHYSGSQEYCELKERLTWSDVDFHWESVLISTWGSHQHQRIFNTYVHTHSIPTPKHTHTQSHMLFFKL